MGFVVSNIKKGLDDLNLETFWVTLSSQGTSTVFEDSVGVQLVSVHLSVSNKDFTSVTFADWVCSVRC